MKEIFTENKPAEINLEEKQRVDRFIQNPEDLVFDIVIKNKKEELGLPENTSKTNLLIAIGRKQLGLSKDLSPMDVAKAMDREIKADETKNDHFSIHKKFADFARELLARQSNRSPQEVSDDEIERFINITNDELAKPSQPVEQFNTVELADKSELNSNAKTTTENPSQKDSEQKDAYVEKLEEKLARRFGYSGPRKWKNLYRFIGEKLGMTSEELVKPDPNWSNLKIFWIKKLDVAPKSTWDELIKTELAKTIPERKSNSRTVIEPSTPAIVSTTIPDATSNQPSPAAEPVQPTVTKAPESIETGEERGKRIDELAKFLGERYKYYEEQKRNGKKNGRERYGVGNDKTFAREVLEVLKKKGYLAKMDPKPEDKEEHIKIEGRRITLR